MNEERIDRLAKALGTAAARRVALGGLIAAALIPHLPASGVGGKRRKRKKKRPPCVPNCNRRVCGADGCGGSCGACSASTACDARGHFVGCQETVDCAARTCQLVSCRAETCVYDNSPDGSDCGNGRDCCSGTGWSRIRRTRAAEFGMTAVPCT